MKFDDLLEQVWKGIGQVFSMALLLLLTSFIVLAVYVCIYGITYLHNLLYGGM